MTMLMMAPNIHSLMQILDPGRGQDPVSASGLWIFGAIISIVIHAF